LDWKPVRLSAPLALTCNQPLEINKRGCARAASAVDRTALMKKLKAQCGAGGKVAGDAIEIQGDHAARLVELLVAAGYKGTKKSGGK
jgi:hypothetical protein